jgi:hypothetical protein
MKNLTKQLEEIQTREDLASFIIFLRKDLITNTSKWENSDLGSFLEAMSAWIRDMDGYYHNQGKPFSEDQPWKMIGEILFASRMYE